MSLALVIQPPCRRYFRVRRNVRGAVKAALFLLALGVTACSKGPVASTPVPISKEDLSHVANLSWDLQSYQKSQESPKLRGRILVLDVYRQDFSNVQDVLPEHLKPQNSVECREATCAVLLQTEARTEEVPSRRRPVPGVKNVEFVNRIHWVAWVADLKTKQIYEPHAEVTSITETKGFQVRDNIGYFNEKVLEFLNGLLWETK